MEMKRRKKQLKPVVKLKSNYLSADDPAQWIWSNRTHSSASEAFRDADYATAFWKEDSDFMQTMRFLRGMGEGAFIVFMTLLIPVLLFIWIFR